MHEPPQKRLTNYSNDIVNCIEFQLHGFTKIDQSIKDTQIYLRIFRSPDVIEIQNP